MRNRFQYIEQGPREARKVFFTGATALARGMMLCFDSDRGTATSQDETRFTKVELPSQSNNHCPAGVVVRAYSADAAGQIIEIEECTPGSATDILVAENMTIGQIAVANYIVGGDDAGHWLLGGYAGKGAVLVRQTATDGNLALAEFMGGVPSGGIEVIEPLAAGGAHTFMVGGETRLTAQTLAANVTFTMANGTYNGMRKRWVLEGAMTTNDVVITTDGEQLDGTTDFTTLTMDADNDVTELEWGGLAAAPGWKIIHNAGTTIG